VDRDRRCRRVALRHDCGLLRSRHFATEEFGPEIDFREEFIWSAPSVTVGVDFAADEAVEHAWIDSVQVCPCAPPRQVGSAINNHK
jgi:hypothetical protein